MPDFEAEDNDTDDDPGVGGSSNTAATSKRQSKGKKKGTASLGSITCTAASNRAPGIRNSCRAYRRADRANEKALRKATGRIPQEKLSSEDTDEVPTEFSDALDSKGG